MIFKFKSRADLVYILDNYEDARKQCRNSTDLAILNDLNIQTAQALLENRLEVFVDVKNGQNEVKHVERIK